MTNEILPRMVAREIFTTVKESADTFLEVTTVGADDNHFTVKVVDEHGRAYRVTVTPED
jgi:hypothetical protein